MALGILIFINSRYFRTVLMLFYTQLFRRVEKWFHLLQVQSMVWSQVLALSQPYNWTGFYSHQECIGTWGIYRIWGESFFNHLRPSRFLRSVFGGNWSGNKQIETAVFIFDIYISLETIFPQGKAMTICKNLLISSGFLIIDQKHLNQHNITLPDRNQLLLNWKKVFVVS